MAVAYAARWPERVSRLVLLDSRNHLLTATEPAWPEFLAHVEELLTE